MLNVKIPIRSIIPLSFTTLRELKDNNGTVILVVLSAAGIGSAVLENFTLLVVAIIALAIFYGNKCRLNTRINYKDGNLYYKHGLHTITHTQLAAYDIQRIDEVKDLWSLVLGITTLKIYSNGATDAVVTARYVLKADALELRQQCHPHAPDEQTADFLYAYTPMDVAKACLLTGLKHFYMVGATQFVILTTVGMKYLPFNDALKDTKSIDETILTSNPSFILDAVTSVLYRPEALLFVLTMLFFILVIASQVARLTYLAPKFWAMNITAKNDQIKISSGFVFFNESVIKTKDIVRVTMKRGLVGKMLSGVSIKINTVSSLSSDHFELYIPYMTNQQAAEFMSVLGYDVDPVVEPKRSKIPVSVFAIYLLSQLWQSALPLIALVLFVPQDKFSSETLSVYLLSAPCLLIVFILFKYRCFYNASVFDDTHVFLIGSFSWEPLIHVFHKERVQLLINVTSPLFPSSVVSKIITTDSYPMYVPSTSKADAKINN